MPKVFVNLGPAPFEHNSQGGSGNSARPVGVGAVSQPWILGGRQSELQTRITGTIKPL